MKVLDGYPSASGICFYKEHLYIIGDDAFYLLITDLEFNAVDRINLFPARGGRIHKSIKSDIESITIISLD
ncbi:MAG: hypothetical protein ABIO04_06580 [Ferruginibacter sp.]